MTMPSCLLIVRTSAALLAVAILAGCGQREEGAATSSATEDAAGSSIGAGASSQAKASLPPKAFATCNSCHAVTPGRNSIGPSLAGVWQRKAGSMAGFTYSPALKGSGIVWNAQTLDRWLQSPTQMVPGTRMVIGLPNPEARKMVIDYLETLK